MSTHHCIDPNDPYAEVEVLVEFESCAGGVRLISVLDTTYYDILPALEEMHLEMLMHEIADACRDPAMMKAHDGSS